MELRLGDHLPVPAVHDVLGYLAPGTGLAVGLLVIEALAQNAFTGTSTPVSDALGLLSLENKNIPSVAHAVAALVLLLSVYLVGQLIDALSKLVIDRFLVFKGYGYPYENLLRLPGTTRIRECKRLRNEVRGENGISIRKLFREPPDSLSWAVLSQMFYRGIFGWGNLTIFFGTLGVLFWTVPPARCVFLVIAACLGLNFVALVVCKTRRSGALQEHALRYQIGKLGSQKSPDSDKIRRKLKWVQRWFAGPIERLAKPLAHLLATRRSFSPRFLKEYEHAFKTHFPRLNCWTGESNNYWMPLIFLRTNAPALYHMAARWHNLYRFSRNLATAAYLVFLYALGRSVYAIVAGHPNGFVLLVGMAFGSVAVVLLIQYYYLYVCYYSKFLFRAFVYTATRRVSSPSEDTP